MNPEYDIYEQIDLYLGNKLSHEEKMRFTEKISQDKSLQELVEAQKMANEIILDNEMIHLKERMRKDLDNGNDSTHLNRNTIILSSLLIISASVGSYFYFTSEKQPEGKTISASQPEFKADSLKEELKQVIIKNKTSLKKTKEVPLSIAPAKLSEDTIKSDLSDLSEEAQLPEQKTGVEDFIFQEVAIKADTKVAQENKKINCDEIKIEASTNVNFGFNSDATITIDAQSIKGGVAPYLFSMDKETFTSSSKFKNVKEGVYNIYIKDHNNCICTLEKPVVVKQVVYPKEIDDVFNPSMGDKWVYPIKNSPDGTVTIFNTSGAIVYTVRINGGYPGEWDGRGNNGNELGTGNYYFIINFTNNELVKGHITIVR